MLSDRAHCHRLNRPAAEVRERCDLRAFGERERAADRSADTAPPGASLAARLALAGRAARRPARPHTGPCCDLRARDAMTEGSAGSAETSSNASSRALPGYARDRQSASGNRRRARASAPCPGSFASVQYGELLRTTPLQRDLRHALRRGLLCEKPRDLPAQTTKRRQGLSDRRARRAVERAPQFECPLECLRLFRNQLERSFQRLAAGRDPLAVRQPDPDPCRLRGELHAQKGRMRASRIETRDERVSPPMLELEPGCDPRIVVLCQRCRKTVATGEPFPLLAWQAEAGAQHAVGRLGKGARRQDRRARRRVEARDEATRGNAGAPALEVGGLVDRESDQAPKDGQRTTQPLPAGEDLLAKLPGRPSRGGVTTARSRSDTP